MILSLLAGRDGSLWIGTNDGLVHMEHRGLTRYKSGHGVMISPIVQDEAGKIWFHPFQFDNDSDDVLCSVAQSQLSCYGKKAGLSSRGPYIPLAMDGSGKLWLGGSDSIVGWKEGAAEIHSPEALKDNKPF